MFQTKAFVESEGILLKSYSFRNVCAKTICTRLYLVTNNWDSQKMYSHLIELEGVTFYCELMTTMGHMLVKENITV